MPTRGQLPARPIRTPFAKVMCSRENDVEARFVVANMDMDE
jgi:hypothetical protein